MITYFRWVAVVAALCLVAVSPGVSATFFVDASRPDDSGDGTTWATAKKTIQAGIDQTAVGDTVLVTNGLYNLGGTVGYPAGMALTNRVAITSAIAVRAVSSDPLDTIIEGEAEPGGTNGPSAARCVYMVDGSILSGFTLTNGNTFAAGGGNERYGGGVFGVATSIVTNCIIVGNSSSLGGGGVYGGVYCVDSLVQYNVSYNGGGGYGCVFSNCVVYTNYATQYGGAGYSCEFYNCMIVSNRSSSWGGGLYSGTAYDSTLIGNRGGSYGSMGISATFIGCTASDHTGYGGIGRNATCIRCIFTNNLGVANRALGMGGTYENCLFMNNEGGASAGRILGSSANVINCTLVSNINGAVDATCSVTNCIVYYNEGGDFCGTSNVSYSCASSTNGLLGPGNITNAPMFIDQLTKNYHIHRLSPCVDTGNDLSGSGLTNDLDNTARPLDGNGDGTAEYDMGCYEYVLPPPGTMFMGW